MTWTLVVWPPREPPMACFPLLSRRRAHRQGAFMTPTRSGVICGPLAPGRSIPGPPVRQASNPPPRRPLQGQLAHRGRILPLTKSGP
jgi:hypothetical protein